MSTNFSGSEDDGSEQKDTDITAFLKPAKLDKEVSYKVKQNITTDLLSSNTNSTKSAYSVSADEFSSLTETKHSEKQCKNVLDGSTQSGNPEIIDSKDEKCVTFPSQNKEGDFIEDLADKSSKPDQNIDMDDTKIDIIEQLDAKNRISFLEKQNPIESKQIKTKGPTNPCEADSSKLEGCESNEDKDDKGSLKNLKENDENENKHDEKKTMGDSSLIKHCEELDLEDKDKIDENQYFNDGNKMGDGPLKGDKKSFEASHESTKSRTTSTVKQIEKSKNVASSKKIRLKFHIIVPSEELDKYKTIQFSFQKSFKNYSFGEKMRFIGNLIEGVAILLHQVDLSLDHVITSTISYKYTMGKTSHDYNINFNFLKGYQDSNEWNIYNACFPEKPSKSILQRFKSYWSGDKGDDVSNILHACYNELFPKKLSDCRDAGNYTIFQFACVYKSAEFAFSKFDIKKDALQKMALESLKMFLQGSEEDCLSRASCVLFILKDLSLTHEINDHFPSLCIQLAVKPDIKSGSINYDRFCKSFPSDRWKRKIADALLDFLKRIMREDHIDPSWVFTLPFLHFLEGKSKPFEEPEMSRAHRNAKWWGTEGIEDLVEIFKEKMANDIRPLQMYMNVLSPLFEVDHLLPRSLLAITSIRHIPFLIKTKKFPLDACLNNAFYFIKTLSYGDNWNIYEILAAIFDNLDIFISDMKRQESSDEIGRKGKKLQYMSQLTFQLFELVLEDRHCRDDVRIQAIKIMANVLLGASHFIEMLPEKREANDLFHEQFNKTIQKINRWLCGYSFDINSTIDACSQLLELQFNSSIFEERWNLSLKGIFVNKFEKISFDKKCYIFSEISDSLNANIVNWMSEIMLKEIENGWKRQMGKFNIVFEHDNNHNFQKLFDKIINQVWSPKDDDISLMNFVLGHPLFPKLANLYRMKNLGEESQVKLAQTLSLLENVEQSLHSGSIKIKMLNILLNAQEAFLRGIHSFFSEDENNWEKKEEIIINLLKIARSDVEFYRKKCTQIRILLGFCDDISYQDELNILRNEVSRDVNELSLGAICKKSNEGEQVLLIMKIGSFDRGMLQFLEENQRSLILRKFWMDLCKKTQFTSGCSISDIVRFIYEPCRGKWDGTSKSLGDGCIMLSDVYEMFDSLNDAEMDNELKLLCKGDIRKTLEKVINCKKLRNCKIGARIMLEIKDMFELKGSFKDAEKIADAVKLGGMKLNELTDELVKECNILSDFDDVKRRCLEVFIEEKEFVDWLRQELSGPKEIKVLVDLALSSAEGQGDMEVEKASCLHAAATAYSTLIYDLKPEMGFREFNHLCQPVLNVAKVDAGIAKKFKDAARQLEWFIGVKESHGAVEVNAIQSASHINSKGIFTIGNLSAKDTGALSLEDIVELKLHLKKGDRDIDEASEGSEAEKWKVYDLKKLYDLQSKLMLVAGKAQEGRKDIEGFNRTLDAVLRLSSLYVELVNRGCCMFTTWSVTFFCNPAKSTYAQIGFASNDVNGSEYICGKNSSSKLKIFERIEKLCHVLEDCLQDWNQYIKGKRLDGHFINFFTTKQLVVLQREIASALNDETGAYLRTELSLLLSHIQPSCHKKELISAATSALQLLPKQQEEIIEVDTFNVSFDEVSLSAFVKSLLEAGISLQLAKRAEANCDDIEEGIIWCMENEEFVEKEEMLHSDQIMDDKNLRPNKTIFSTFLRDETHNLGTKINLDKSSMEDKFLEMWKTFLEKVDAGFADYISLEHLSIILESLGSAGHSTKISRILPCNMKRGKPNLLLVDQNELWINVLSIYANSYELPLPSLDEVLVCNPKTSAEEIEILCLRAKKERSGKLYCLVNADKLNYNVAVCMEKYVNLMGEDATFIIVCSSNSHSHVANAFDQFKIRFTSLDYDDIQKYVQRHLTQRNSVFSVDPEMCCARLIKSNQAGAGKTLRVQRAVDHFFEKTSRQPLFLTIPLHNRDVDVSSIVKKLRKFAVENKESMERIIHFDISSEVMEGVDSLLFSLLILGGLSDEDGYVWKKLPGDIYLIESCPLITRTKAKSNFISKESQYIYLHKMFYLLPSLTCWSPRDSLQIIENNIGDQLGSAPTLAFDQKLDEKEFRSEHFRRVFEYLSPKLTNKANIIMDRKNCIEVLTRFCGVDDPSWAELKHFIDFFNNQLIAYERSVFCQTYMVQDLPGFRNFVINFMLLMSQDFATRSLKISEESPVKLNDVSEILNENLLGGYEMKRTWETSCHPYLFFNDDNHSFTFIGFVVDRATGNIINPENNQILMRSAVDQQLFDALQRNGVSLAENFNRLSRLEKLKKMATIMGLDVVHDPDENYELTADNVKKMLAIYMRFRCNIPVVIMGETGCGKTSLIKFLCNFMKPPFSEMKNMFLMKVHGGTTIQNVVDKIKKVSELAKQNSEEIPGIHSVLFFDEANTTAAIGMIKEAMCDHTICGEPFGDASLKLIAACNPYRKHSDALISKLEKAGLGYHVNASRTTDRLGAIPMRQLVYRVRSLPPSMFPLVWDFGNLDEEAEMLYIKQMVQSCICKDLGIQVTEALVTNLSDILAASQSFMREQNDECSFVSLRDVDRCLKVMVWFNRHKDIFYKMDELKSKRHVTDEVDYDGYEYDDDSDHDDGDNDYDDDDNNYDEREDDDNKEDQIPDDLSRSLILALGVCYHACLSKRQEYRMHIARYFASLCNLQHGPDTLEEEISLCQDVFLDEIDLDENIARNQALKENLFVMVVCIELRMPLFLIGKPGSSKSLAKTIVADVMQGNQSKSDLFRSFKSVHMVSYQCSPLSTPEGITGMFRQCAKLQEAKDLNKFVSIVVLDEVGLAEDSEKMPLKALHPLLEDGCEDEDDILPHKKVAFIGISNWSLDPAKMNRGIFVQRSSPDERELILSAKGICSSDEITSKFCEKLFRPLARGYLKLCESTVEIKEFFGLRDFYSMIKMIYAISKRLRKIPSWIDLQRVILRNFSGMEKTETTEIFKEFLKEVVDTNEEIEVDDNSLVAVSLIRESLMERNQDYENRYLLILMEDYSSFNLLQNDLLQMDDAIIIFGSSFPKDLEYTQICRNINRIKICMETGKTIVLLNLENLYESLYDALNQYYVMIGDQRFVDLGLGTQRVKCKVHKSFRLIVVADKQVVYNRFPIPLLNRLEKHYLAIESLLTPEQVDIMKELQDWVDNFTSESPFVAMRKKATLTDVFIGFHQNALASLVLQASSNLQSSGKVKKEEVLNHCKDLLLQCAVPESVIRLASVKEDFGKDVYKTYFQEQHHSSLANFIKSHILEKTNPENVFAQLTTHSRLMSRTEVNEMTEVLELLPDSIKLFSLQVFDTEQQFCGAIKGFFESTTHHNEILLVQCDSGEQHEDLIACTRFIILNEYSNWNAPSHEKCMKHVLFVVQLPKVMGGCFVGFQGGKWLSYHIDNLLPDSHFMSLLPQMRERSVSSLLSMDSQQEQQEQDIVALNKILENCIHGAASLLKSPVIQREKIGSRKAERLEPLIRNLFTKNDDNVTFLDLLRRRVSMLVREREDKVMIDPYSWLSKEAASLESVCTAGSFCNSVTLCLEAKVTPILAYIISYIDSNCNLDLLNSPDQWIVKLWFEMFENPNITFMKYSDIQTISQAREVLQFDVRTFGHNGSVMRGQLPFSWLIKDNLDKFASFSHLHSGWKNEERFSDEETFGSSVGKLLAKFTQDKEIKQKMFDLYLSDYIQMMYRPCSDEKNKEFELVIKDVKSVISASLLSDEQNGNETLSLYGIHNVYNEHCFKYKLFAEFVALCPESIDPLHDKIDSIHMSLLEQSLIYALESLAFSKGVDSTHLKSWSCKVKSLTSVVNQLFFYLQTEDRKIDTNGWMCSWNRICALKLFVEHMSTNNVLEHDIYLMLWKCLGESCDLKTLKCFLSVEKFLNVCNKRGVRKCFGNILVTKCSECEQENGIIRLLCNHSYCQECIDVLKSFHQNKCIVSGCGKCAEKEPQDIKEESQQKYVAFKGKLNSFFMALISKMCFDGQEPPDEKIVEKLLNFVVFKSEVDDLMRTRNLLLRCNDPNPVIRSFLLQLLLRHQMASVKIHLESFLSDNKRLFQSDSDQTIELGILCLNCFEDHYRSLGMTKIGTTEKLEFVRDLWRRHDLSSITYANDAMEVKTLQNLALLRYGLMELAMGLHDHYILRSLDDCGYRAMRSLGDLANVIFLKSNHARLFLLKQLTHKFGFQILLQFSDEPSCKWFISPCEIKSDEKKFVDNFLLSNGGYKDTRDTLLDSFCKRNLTLLDQDKHTEYNIMLALFQQTFNSSTNDDSFDSDLEVMQEYFSKRNDFKNQDLALDILKKKLMFVAYKQNPSQADRSLLLVIFHFMVATRYQQKQNIIIQMICLPFNKPQFLEGAFLPTMPQDDEFETIQLIRTKEPIALYKCPNGHPYSIGDCGNPVMKTRCPTCGLEIGGMSYVPQPGNTKFDLTGEKTLPGHILGRPDEPGAPKGDRTMSPLQLSLTRFFLHVSMYIGSFHFDLSKAVIKPKIDPEAVHEFIWNHMHHDLEMIKIAAGKNYEDILILLHSMIRCIYENKIPDPGMPINWDSKNGRSDWEKKFIEEYIRPPLENVNEVIERGRKLVLEDDGLVLSPLMRDIYELSTQDNLPENLWDPLGCHIFWKYRDLISKEHLLLNLQNITVTNVSKSVREPKVHMVLQHFLENSHILQEIRQLPKILELHSKLYLALNRRISITEADEFSISKFLKGEDEVMRMNLRGLFQHFISSWNALKFNLTKFVFLKTALPTKYLEEPLNFESKLGFFLPSMHNQGICSVALVHYLAEQQNLLLDVYGRFLGKSITKEVSLEECTPVHLVSFDPEKDLHTLILAHCKYSLEIGKCTKLEYDYANLEIQVVDQFIYDKPRIRANVKFISFKEDFNTFAVFTELEQRIPQDPTLPEVLDNDFKILSDVSKSLHCFNAVLEYIASDGHNPDENIVDFMQKTLKMKNVFVDYPSMAHLKFKHAKQAWVTLSFIQAKLQVKNGQLPFRGVDHKYKQLMLPEDHQKLMNSFQHVRVELFSSLLYECILEMTNSKEDNEEIDNSDHSLSEILLEFISSKGLDGNIKALENGTFPREIQARHCVDVWLCSVDPVKRILLE